LTARRSPALTPTSPSSPVTQPVEDDGQAHRGIAAIRAWRSKAPRAAYTIHDVKATTAGHDAAVDIAGDLPGSPVSMRVHFQFAADGRITALTIRP
jgi:hypothetical protein